MEFLFDGVGQGSPTVLLAHGAGAPMDSPFMNLIAAELAEQGLCVVRFEFAYMAGRRLGNARRPPPKADNLREEFGAAVDALPAHGPLIIGGKSLGGRVASLVADDLSEAGKISGLLCLGYPFHPPGRPDTLRTAHLENIRTSTLICQGTRDPLGARPEVTGYRLSGKVDIFWVEDGDHDLKPRKSVTGESHEDAVKRVAAQIGSWIRNVSSMG